jgi:hypothetical protein
MAEALMRNACAAAAAVSPRPSRCYRGLPSTRLGWRPAPRFPACRSAPKLAEAFATFTPTIAPRHKHARHRLGGPGGWSGNSPNGLHVAAVLTVQPKGYDTGTASICAPTAPLSRSGPSIDGYDMVENR